MVIVVLLAAFLLLSGLLAWWIPKPRELPVLSEQDAARNSHPLSAVERVQR